MNTTYLTIKYTDGTEDIRKATKIFGAEQDTGLNRLFKYVDEKGNRHALNLNDIKEIEKEKKEG